MGLDMYLYKNIYVQRWKHIPPERQFEVSIRRGGEPYLDYNPERVAYVVEQVAYWRKANQIHAWFVKNIQDGKDDCKSYYADRTKLARLVEDCKEILNNPCKANELLPPQEGFFFGGTEIDEDYFNDLKDTIRQIGPLLTESLEDELEYRSSW